jgi:pimeloyl-ACP methyl ester carboxylesterase
MIRFRPAALLATVLVLGACSQGSVDTISGFAATGAAMANASVTARCVAGPEVTGTTDANGLFELNIEGGQKAPCIVRVSGGGTTLHSFAAGPGRLNVTPLTELTVSKALGADPSTAFGSFDGTKAQTIGDGLSAAKASIKAQVETLTGQSITGDLFTSTFKVGDPDDVVLDKLNQKLAAAGQQLSDLKVNAAANTPLVPVITAADRGTLVSDAKVEAELSQPIVNLLVTQAGAQALAGTPQCGVKVVSLHYNTVGVIGEKATASAAMLVPTDCTPNGALVAYAKGTDVIKTRTLADANDDETRLLMMMYAAQGYTVVATDYLGFAKSNYTYHPYLHADSQATAIIDGIRAARNAAPAVGATLSGKVVLTGYSQGGHASMAAHRAIERDHAAEIAVIAGAHLAGPYGLSGALQSGVAIAGYQFFVPYVVTSFQKVYGNLYAKAADAFKEPYSTWIDSLLPSPTLTYTTLITQGKLPSTQLMPADARDALFQSSFLAQASNANSNLIQAAKKNDLLGWTPVSPIMLCGGSGDPTIPKALFQDPMRQDLESRGVNVLSVDVDEAVSFAYGSVLNDSPATYYGKYHGEYAPPFCHQAARGFFNGVLLPPI